MRGKTSWRKTYVQTWFRTRWMLHLFGGEVFLSMARTNVFVIHVLFVMYYVFSYFLFFFLLNFFLLLKKMVILKRYLLLNLLTTKGFGKISLNWDSFFTLFIGCLQWLSNFTLLSQGSQRLRNWNDTKWVVSTVDETSCIHWTPPGCPRVDHPIARYRWVGMLLSTKIT